MRKVAPCRCGECQRCKRRVMQRKYRAGIPRRKWVRGADLDIDRLNAYFIKHGWPI